MSITSDKIIEETHALFFYDCLDEAAPLEALDAEYVPDTLDEAATFVRRFNRAACKRRKIVRLLGLFPVTPAGSPNLDAPEECVADYAKRLREIAEELFDISQKLTD